MTSLAQESPQLQSRYTNTAHAVHSRFDQGMIRDIASWELPEGALYDAQDLLCDYVGKIRKRGGTTSPASGNSTATVENLAALRSAAYDAITGIAGSSSKTGAITTFNRSTGAATTLLAALAASVSACRPFQHQNMLVFSHQMLAPTTSDTNRVYFWGGATARTTFSAGTVTAGDNRITGLTGAAITSAQLGGFIYAADGSGTTRFSGRVIEILSTTSVRVEPTPVTGFTIASSSSIEMVAAPSEDVPLAGGGVGKGAGDVAGRFGVSYQNRLVFADVAFTDQSSRSTYPANGVVRYAQRVQWSVLPTEGINAPGGLALDGNNLLSSGFMTNTGATADTLYNYVDIPAIGTITGLAAIGDGELLVFGQRTMYVISGQLTTNTVANNAIGFSVDEAPANVGCVSAASIQYVQGGLVWAAYDNVYQYAGSKLSPLLTGKNARWFQDLLASGATIYGSAYSGSRHHYYLSLSGAQGGLMINLDTLAQTRQTGPSTQIFAGATDPTDPTKLWAARWWDTTGAAPTMTKGQLVALDPIWLPTSANKADADGTSVLYSLQTASYVDGRIGTNKLPVDLNMTYKMPGTGSPTATLQADTKLDTSDASWVTIDSAVPGQTTTTTKDWETGALLPDGQAVEYKLFANATSDSFELDALDIGSHQGPDGFST